MRANLKRGERPITEETMVKPEQAAHLRRCIQQAIQDANVAQYHQSQHRGEPTTIFLVLNENQSDVELHRQIDKTGDVPARIVGTVDTEGGNLNPFGQQIMKLGLRF